MAKAATAPLPQVHSQAVRNVRSRGSYRTASIEERTGVLEARWEETVPTLATKADISDLRSEIIKWVVGAGLALLAVTVALFTANTARIDRLDAKIDARFDAIMAELREQRGK